MPSSKFATPKSPWVLALFGVWALLVVRIALAIIRNESINGDLSLPVVGLFVTTALVASRVWLHLQGAPSEESAPSGPPPAFDPPPVKRQHAQHPEVLLTGRRSSRTGS